MAEPITIKGGSVEIEFEDTFETVTGGERKKKFKHPHETEAKLTKLVIRKNGSQQEREISLNCDDTLEIHYNEPVTQIPAE